MKKQFKKKKSTKEIIPAILYNGKKYILHKSIAHYVIEGIYTLEEGFYLIHNNEEYNPNSLRYQIFERSNKCCYCGCEGILFLRCRDSANKSARFHLNLVGLKDGELILFTKDHITPKSKGGLDTIENMQTMCVICNRNKGNKEEGVTTLKAQPKSVSVAALIKEIESMLECINTFYLDYSAKEILVELKNKLERL